MSALDDAIQAHMTHGAGACADPLTDSLADQAQPCLREGWAHEPIDPPIPWAFYAVVVAVTVALSALLTGCGGDTGPDDTSTTQPVNCITNPERCK